MASIFNLWRDEDPTREQLFRDIAPTMEEEEPEVEEDIVIPTPVGPVTAAKPEKQFIKKYWKDEEGNLLGTEEASEELKQEAPASVVIENPSKNVSRTESQKAIKDFFQGKLEKGDWLDLESPMADVVRAKKEAMDLAKEPTELQKKYKELGLEYDYSKRAERGSILSEERFEEKEAQRQALDARLDAKLNEVKSQFDVAIKESELKKKFNEIESRKNQSIKSIEKAELSIVANSNYAGSPRGKYELTKLAQQKKEIMEQSIADQEKLGLSAWEAMPSDAKLVYTRMSQTGEITPKDAIEYTSLNNEITKGTQSLMLDLRQMGVDENKINEIDDYIFGKKQIVNGQVQYDQDNQPVRISKGLAFKNKFGIYEPSVDLDTFENGLKNIAKQYTEANVGGTRGGEQESNQYKMAAEFLKDAKVLEDIEEDKYKQRKGKTADYTLTKSFEEGITTEEDKKRIEDLKAAAAETTKYGGAFDKEERAKRQQKESETQVNSMLRELQANPTREGLKNAFDQGLVRTYEVVDNKLVDKTSGPVQNDEFVIIVDPDERIGGQLVNIGKDKIKEFEEDAKNLFYVNGQLTRNAPSWVGNIFAGSETRNKALGIGTSKFNKFLEEARNIKLQSEESIKAKEKKEKEKEELKF